MTTMTTETSTEPEKSTAESPEAETPKFEPASSDITSEICTSHPTKSIDAPQSSEEHNKQPPEKDEPAPLVPTITPDFKLHAAKKRRIDAQHLDAKTRLTRPFRSPLKAGSTHNPSASPTSARSVSYGINHNNSTVVSQRRSMSAAVPSVSATSSNNPPFKSAFTPKKTKTRTATATEPADPELLSLQKELQSLESELRGAKANLEKTVQAVKIQESGEDPKLEQLIVKWRSASQKTADHLFEIAEARVEKMGGVSAWRDMNERDQMGGGGSWGYDDQNGEEGGQIDPEEKERLREEYEAEYGVERDDESEAHKKSASTNEEVFTMEMMLKTLNIEHGVIGYDKDYQRWK